MWSKRLTGMLLVLALVAMMSVSVLAKDGYSDFDDKKTGVEGEEEVLQYGYKVPTVWSPWSATRTNDPFEVKGASLQEYYAYSELNNQKYWFDAKGKELFTWEFGESARVVRVYLDVDVYVDGSFTNYAGPPLHVYCDGKEIASSGFHNHLHNFDYYTDCNCRLLKVTMDDGGGEGRNTTAMVGSWVTVQRDQYRYVEEWSDGQGWRADEPYEIEYGEEPKLPAERLVYTRPLIYKISYDLDGGEFLSEPKNEYRVIDEFWLSEPLKKGYEYRGFDLNGQVVRKIQKGTTGDLYLKALYERKDPKIYVPVKTYRKDEEYTTADLKIGVKAIDELEGDLSERVEIVKIVYEDEHVVYGPSALETDKVQELLITYRVCNSDDKTAEVEQKAYVLGEGELIKRGEVYPRYLSKNYDSTLDPDSIWRSGAYRLLLNEVYRLMEE